MKYCFRKCNIKRKFVTIKLLVGKSCIYYKIQSDKIKRKEKNEYGNCKFIMPDENKK
jgi:hypothetical protein